MFKIVRKTSTNNTYASMFIGRRSETLNRELQFTPNEWTQDFHNGLGITCFKSLDDINTFLKLANDTILYNLIHKQMLIFTCQGKYHINRKYLPSTNHYLIDTFYKHGAIWDKAWMHKRQKAPQGTRFFKQLMIQEDTTEYSMKYVFNPSSIIHHPQSIIHNHR